NPRRSPDNHDLLTFRFTHAAFLLVIKVRVSVQRISSSGFHLLPLYSVALSHLSFLPASLFAKSSNMLVSGTTSMFNLKLIYGKITRNIQQKRKHQEKITETKRKRAAP